MPWGDLLAAALRLNWSPSEFWASTLYELETAIWLALPEANRPPGQSPDDLRAFFIKRSG